MGNRYASGNNIDHAELEAKLKKVRSPFSELEKVGLQTPGGLKAAGSVQSFFGKIKDKAEIFMRPRVKNSIYPEVEGAPSGKYVQRNVRGPEELEAIKESGYMLPKEGGKKQKYFTQTDNVNTNVSPCDSVLRVPIEKVPKNRAVSRKDVQKYNQDSGEFEPLKKGGLTASSRADGCASRGKTKGRFV
jgi:hypothetical protein